jgi:hypothetical protein
MLKSALAPSKQQVLQLYRGLLRNSSSFKDSRLKTYAQRRIGAEFRQHTSLQDETAINREYNAGVNQLQVVGKYAADFQGQTASFANNYH